MEMNLAWIIFIFFSSYLNLIAHGLARSRILRNPSRIPGEIAKKKCSEYVSTIYDTYSIAGGTPSLAREFPHMAAVGYGIEKNIEWLCGGSLISKKFVLTAAHCVVKKVDGPKFIRLGDLDLTTDKDDARPQQFTVRRSIAHPSYNKSFKYHDIALVELNREAVLTPYVSPACLNTEKNIRGGRLTAMGWGRTGYTEGVSSILRKVYLDLVPNSNCQKYFKRFKTDLPKGVMDAFQICAGKVKGQDTCQGDSGGPLQIKDSRVSKRVHIIYGVTSFGRVCAISGSPSIYTRVSNYITWIEKTVWENGN